MRISVELSRSWRLPKKAWYKKDDEQAQWVYLAERQFIGGMVYASVPLRELRTIAKFLCRQYRVPPPKIISYEAPDHRYGFAIGDEIHLNRHEKSLGVNTHTLVHELAHYVCDRFYDTDVEHHGPEFAAIYGWMLDRINVLPRNFWDMLCEDYNVIQAHDGSPEDVRK